MAEVHSQTNGEVVVVYLGHNRIVDQAIIDQIAGTLERLLGKCEQGKMLINFEGVKFMGSAMLGKLIKLKKSCKDLAVHLKICSIDPQIMQVFKMTKLDKVFDIYDDEGRALSAFEKKGWLG